MNGYVLPLYQGRCSLRQDVVQGSDLVSTHTTHTAVNEP